MLCLVDCKLGEWERWSPCSFCKTDSSGNQTRKKEVLWEERNGGNCNNALEYQNCICPNNSDSYDGTTQGIAVGVALMVLVSLIAGGVCVFHKYSKRTSSMEMESVVSVSDSEHLIFKKEKREIMKMNINFALKNKKKILEEFNRIGVDINESSPAIQRRNQNHNQAGNIGKF